jgi:uncharacterized membrane protein YfcA
MPCIMVIVSTERDGLDDARSGRRLWRQGPWPVVVATAVALVGPALLVVFPSQLMFWLMWLFEVPLIVLALYVFKKAEDEGRKQPEDTSDPRAETVWWPPSDL